MSEPKKPGDVPDSADDLAKILEEQKARGKDEPVELPPVTYTTAFEGQEVEEGALPCDD